MFIDYLEKYLQLLEDQAAKLAFQQYSHTAPFDQPNPFLDPLWSKTGTTTAYESLVLKEKNGVVTNIERLRDLQYKLVEAEIDAEKKRKPQEKKKDKNEEEKNEKEEKEKESAFDLKDEKVRLAEIAMEKEIRLAELAQQERLRMLEIKYDAKVRLSEVAKNEKIRMEELRVEESKFKEDARKEEAIKMQETTLRQSEMCKQMTLAELKAKLARLKEEYAEAVGNVQAGDPGPVPGQVCTLQDP
ncbi:hypothetical protein BGX28_008052 [Mortierella sp. GBA30]|nr:hypothetical protein BGX28_008052 [Mortierella sp. GBA30]